MDNSFPHISLTLTGAKKEYIDFLIYIPHAEIDPSWISYVRETAQEDISQIGDDLLMEYIEHEADIGMREVARHALTYLSQSEWSIGLLDVRVPRAFCDMNRPRDRAISPILSREKWLPIYDNIDVYIDNLLPRVGFMFHLHSMNNFDPVRSWVLGENLDASSIIEHMESTYAGRRRECTLLTETDLGEYISEHIFDGLLREAFGRKGIPLEENTAYKLGAGYPCDTIMKRVSGSFLEIRKGSLATSETMDMLNTSKTLFDPAKIELFGSILADIIIHYLSSLGKK